MISKELRQKAAEFLACKNVKHLEDILRYFQDCVRLNAPLSTCLLTIEHVFTELLQRKEMTVLVEPLMKKDTSPETLYRERLISLYQESYELILECFDATRQIDATQALVTAVHLMSWEGKCPLDSVDEHFPVHRLKMILIQILSPDKSRTHCLQRFFEFSNYLDILFYAWKILPSLTPKGAVQSDIFIKNYLDLINALPITNEVEDANNFLCFTEAQSDVKIFNYQLIKKFVGKCWNCVMVWELSPEMHKHVLIILLERVLPHLDKPLLLTDFLMDSLDIGGTISLLALQGVFTLIQMHNLNYPNIYEKLYSMFEPEIFHTKCKARLFFLADIFLSSTHLPEMMVAAFAKRLARLSMVAPQNDIVIIVYFIGNLLLRHPGLKRMISHSTEHHEITKDPYMMDERNPNKSNAIESSLWEIAALQNHALPKIASVARFISNPLPNVEWDLASVLEVTENDVFDQEIARKSKDCALSFERPISLSLQNGKDKVEQYFCL